MSTAFIQLPNEYFDNDWHTFSVDLKTTEFTISQEGSTGVLAELNPPPRGLDYIYAVHIYIPYDSSAPSATTLELADMKFFR